jgi:hypothetical protein
LTLGRFFTRTRLADFFAFVGRSRPGLWGLALGGGGDANFSGNIQHVLRCVDALQSLAVLHLDGQLLTESDTEALAQWLPRHRAIAEIALDGTAVASEPVLAGLYQSLATVGVKVIGRPEADVKRLNGAPKAIERIKNALQNALPASTAALRAHFLALHPGEFKRAEYEEFCRRYPRVRCELAAPGAAFPEYAPPSPPLRSLAEIGAKGDARGLNEIHLALLADPEAPPPWQSEAAAGDDPLLETEIRTLDKPLALTPGRRSMTIHLRRPLIVEVAAAAAGSSPPTASPSPLALETLPPRPAPQRTAPPPAGAPVGPAIQPVAPAGPPVALEVPEILELELVPLPEVATEEDEETIIIPESPPAVIPEFFARLQVPL